MSEKTTKPTPVEAEANDLETTTLSFTFKGQEFNITIPSDSQDYPLQVFRYMQNENPIDAFYALLDVYGPGEKKTLDRMGFSLREFTTTVMPAWTDIMGLGE